MKKIIDITRPDFQTALPVGVSVHDEVYDSVVPAISDSVAYYTESMLGDGGMERMADTEGAPLLEHFFKNFVCIEAFLSVFRQLDLVLTPTGFGIVSNDTLSPASKQRVDALEEQLRTALCRTRAMTVNMLCSPRWGTMPQARCYMRYIYSEHCFFFSPHDAGARTYRDWQAMQIPIRNADAYLRQRFSDAQVDDMLDACRRADRDRLMPYAAALQLMCDLTDQWAADGRRTGMSPTERRLVEEMEQQPDTFALYHGSNAYTCAHTPPFANDKNSTAFFFNG